VRENRPNENFIRLTAPIPKSGVKMALALSLAPFYIANDLQLDIMQSISGGRAAL
jgi:hypothetical protein